MSVERTYIDYLADILDAIGKVTRFIEGMTFEAFSQDDLFAGAIAHKGFALVDVFSPCDHFAAGSTHR